jgi:uncharacterized protein YfaS (alpha-2-macroglobulin family)
MRTLLIVCALLSAGLLSGPADARSRERKPQQQEQQQQPSRETRVQRPDGSAEAARRAQAQNGGGRVLSVEPEGSGYRVKVLKDGEVRVHHVDAN